MVVLGLLLFGALIGALARVVLPGRQDLSGSATVLAGLLGAGTVGAAVGAFTDGWFVWEGPSLLGSVLGATGFVLLAEWGNRRLRARREQVPTGELLSRGESARVEFKSSARYNVHTSDKDPRLELAIARSVAGFANSSGGTLLIGVDDAGQVLGLDHDLKLVKGGDLDRYELWLHDLLERCLGRGALRYIEVAFEHLHGQVVPDRRRRERHAHLPPPPRR